MALIPENNVTQQDLADWYTLNQQLSDLKTKEMLLRLKIYNGLFVKKDEHGNDILPNEGTNKFKLPDSYELKAQRVINRTVDQAGLAILKAERNDLEEKASQEQLSDDEVKRLTLLRRLALDDLIKYKPELVVKEYRTLTEEERMVFDQILIVKDGTPQMEIVLPKRRT